MKKMAADGKMSIWSNLADGRLDICKDKESNLGPATGY